MLDTASAPAPSRHAVSFIFVTVLLDMVGFGVIMPVLPELIKEVGHMTVADASVIGGWMFFAFSATQFLFGPFMGSLSDAYGRRPLLLIAVFGLFVDYLIAALAPSLTWVFIGRAFAGLCGSSHVIANAYIADVTEPEKRAKAFGLMGAAFGVGFVLGPAIGGLLGEYGPRVPFYVAACVSLVNFVYGWFVLPETLAPQKRRPLELARANPFGTFKVFRSYAGVLPLCVVLFTYFTATAVYPAIWPYWGIAKFQWSAAMIGLTLAGFGIISAICQGALAGPMVKLLGDRRVVLLGLVIGIVAALGYGLVTTFPLLLVMLVIHGPEGLIHPVLTALMSKSVPDDAQGELQGGISSIMNVAMLVGTVFYAQVFGYFMKPTAPIVSPNVGFYICSGALVVTLLLFLVLGRTPSVAAPAESEAATNG